MKHFKSTKHILFAVVATLFSAVTLQGTAAETKTGYIPARKNCFGQHRFLVKYKYTKKNFWSRKECSLLESEEITKLSLHKSKKKEFCCKILQNCLSTTDKPYHYINYKSAAAINWQLWKNKAKFRVKWVSLNKFCKIKFGKKPILFIRSKSKKRFWREG